MAELRRWRERAFAPSLWALRIAVTVAAAGYLFQAVSAGQFLSGDYGFLGIHQAGTTAVDVVMVLALLSAGSLRWAARGSVAPFLATLAAIAASQVQAAVGAARMTWLHVPLAVVVIGAVWVLAWSSWVSPAWTRRPR